jgi:phage gp37-like protein
MSSPILLIEQAIVQQLRTVPRSYKPLIESYAAQLDDEMFGWIRTLPAVWVTFGDVKNVQRKGVHSYIHSGTFEVLSAQRALGENAGRMAGEARADSLGVYELLEHNKLALVNQKLGLPIDPITPGPIRPVMKGMVNNHAVVIYAQEFSTRWMEVYPDPDSVPAGELVSVGLEYFLKPQHSHPGDPPDKTDTLTTST